MKSSIAGLIELGLSEKEALLYQAALKCGPTTAQILSLESGIKRATVYATMESLIQKGLLHIEVKGVRKLYIAAEPKQLTALLDQKKQTLTKILPDLMQEYLKSSSNDNTIKIYYGIPGIKLLYDALLDSVAPGEDYFVISDQDKWMTLDPIYFESFKLKRSKLKLNTRLILKESKHLKRLQASYKADIKTLPDHIDLNINMVMLKNKSILVQLVEPYLAIQIENPNVAAMHKVIFGVLWGLIK
jgi:sugar-specific transcriptional regulator TrmB